MTNEQIIFNAKQDLAKQGILAYTGREIIVKVADEDVIIKEVEEIHTYQKWKEMGFQVQKGEKSQVRIKIWKHVKNKKTDEEKMFLKDACFFTSKQVKLV